MVSAVYYKWNSILEINVCFSFLSLVTFIISIPGFKPLLKAAQSLDHGSPGPSGAKEKQNKPKTRTEISSSQSFNGSKSSHQYFVRKGLTPSFSIGNIVQVLAIIFWRFFLLFFFFFFFFDLNL